ncbi:hypothetical protein H9P43_010144 [Blastocladiella emersonii ATCC 22665]|nr:hypothetical protein H9P43_010144 [Blastocladiella emersonii ATCC 22665]
MHRSLRPVLVTLVLVAVVAQLGGVHAEKKHHGASPVLGVSPSRAARYVPVEGKFTCLDGSRTIAFSAVNDDYCDCPDGSDEPGTAACAYGQFYCRNEGHLPSTIPSSRVNDGICDPKCCDGSDEYDGKVKCPDRCAELGAVWRKQQAAAQATLDEGLRIKESYRAQAAAAKLKHQADLDAANKDLAAIEASLAKLRDRRTAAEAEETAAEEREAKLGRYSPKALAEQVKRLQQVISTADTAANTLRGETPEGGEANPAVQEFLRTYDEARRAVESADLEDLGELPSFVSEDGDADFESGSLMDKLKSIVYKLVKPKPRTSLEVVRKNVESARQAVWDAESKVRDLESKRDAARKHLDLDVGAEPAFAVLADKCFLSKGREYDYELCPFKSAEQRSTGASYGTSLGTWGKWNEDGTWLFENGQGCWNGPNRSVTVTLKCGAKEEITEVSEPNKCEYAMVFVTPAACKAGDKAKVVHSEL